MMLDDIGPVDLPHIKITGQIDDVGQNCKDQKIAGYIDHVIGFSLRIVANTHRFFILSVELGLTVLL